MWSQIMYMAVALLNWLLKRKIKIGFKLFIYTFINDLHHMQILLMLFNTNNIQIINSIFSLPFEICNSFAAAQRCTKIV